MSEGSSETFGARLRRLREARGWTQTDLAQRAGLNQQMVNRLERGVSQQLLVQTLEALADAFGVTLDCLWGRTIEGDDTPPLVGTNERGRQSHRSSVP